MLLVLLSSIPSILAIHSRLRFGSNLDGPSRLRTIKTVRTYTYNLKVMLYAHQFLSILLIKYSSARGYLQSFTLRARFGWPYSPTYYERGDTLIILGLVVVVVVCAQCLLLFCLVEFLVSKLFPVVLDVGPI